MLIRIHRQVVTNRVTRLQTLTTELKEVILTETDENVATNRHEKSNDLLDELEIVADKAKKKWWTKIHGYFAGIRIQLTGEPHFDAAIALLRSLVDTNPPEAILQDARQRIMDHLVAALNDAITAKNQGRAVGLLTNLGSDHLKFPATEIAAFTARVADMGLKPTEVDFHDALTQLSAEKPGSKKATAEVAAVGDKGPAYTGSLPLELATDEDLLHPKPGPVI